MFSTQTATTKNPPGEVVTRLLEESIVETTYRGHCSAELVRSVADITPSVLLDVPRASWLLDMSGATGTEAGARVPGAAILKLFREAGGVEFAVVVSSGPLRMMLIAVAFAAGLPMKLFEKRDEALEFLRSRAAGAPAVPGSAAGGPSTTRRRS